MPDIIRLQEYAQERPAVSSGCLKYRVTKDLLREADELLKARDDSKQFIPKEIFLMWLGLSEEEAKATLPTKTGSITHCIRRQILQNPELKEYNIGFGTHKTNGPESDEVSIKRVMWTIGETGLEEGEEE